MCAINGFNFKDEKLIQEMNQITRHRGPDHTGTFFDAEISLGHNRLSIIDLSERANQPMSSFDGKHIIVFNGEIYNFQELKKALSDYPFRTKSDTEVILASYKKWGNECVKKLNGIFAFAIWDRQKKELFLARDHIGIKPLYYFWDGKKFIFSSELKAILRHNISRRIDLEALNHYFYLSYIPQPLAIFQNIKKLPPAHWMKLKNKNLEIKKYWEIEDRKNFSSIREAKTEIRSTLEDSVKKQIISDRPVGVFLSGGVDSSIILGLIRKFAPDITKTYTTSFKVEVEQEKFNTDSILAAKTAQHYGTEHYELLIGVEDICKNLEKIVWHLDEPNANHTALAMYLLSKQAAKDVKVVLGGDGGDELFGGYPRYSFSRLISQYQKMPLFSRKGFELFLRLTSKEKYIEKLSSAGARRFASFMFTKDKLVSQILKPEICQPSVTKEYFESFFQNYPPEILKSDFEKIFMDADRQTWLVDDSLMRTDRMSMAHALEVRVPILDYRLAEISQKIPTDWKIKGKNGKIIFRQAFPEYLLPHLANKPKTGWFTPMAKWLREEPLKSMAMDILDSLPDEYFQKDEIKKIFINHLNGKVYNLNILWSLISFGIWYDKMG
ncbi:asparagine synthase (glutamine-hydrolyzing) [Patescibacteria group bacterium]|nr:asparagine synthase (glutamine-hydrolyzing) [Patescibacteria group bacterium]